MSFRGLCTDCSTQAVTEAIVAMASKSGPKYDKWAKSMARAARNARRAS